MKSISNDNLCDKSVAKKMHEIRIATNRLVKLAEETDIPIFIACFDPQYKDYQYNALFPEEVGTEDVKSEYGKFDEFLRICIGFNKEEFMPKIVKKKS